MSETEKLAESLIATVKQYVDQAIAAALAPLAEQLRTLPEGPAGRDGRDGERGEKGADGAPGADGRDGKDGRDGVDGKDGRDGKDGAPGADGEKGDDGIPGIPGADGRDGRDGREGPPGRDALHIEILDAIDETRSYARGTYAKHRGGLIRAARRTDPVVDDLADAGWQVVLDPVVGLQFDQSEADPRVFALRGITAFGRLDAKTFRLPAMVYRGVFVEGSDYLPGDTTTWGGSLWHCDAPTRDKPGEGSKAWRLAAKRGRDGRDGKDGERGPEGRAAR